MNAIVKHEQRQTALAPVLSLQELTAAARALGVDADCQRPGYIADIDREFEDDWLLRNARKVRP